MQAVGLRVSRVIVLAAAMLCIFVPAASAACADEDKAPAPGTTGPALLPFIHATDCVLDEVRQAQGLSPLKLDQRLMKAAYWHTVDMTTKDFFSHTGSDGKHVASRGRAQGYGDEADTWMLGETLGWGETSMASPRQIVDAWLASPAHRPVVLNPEFRDVGIMIFAEAPTPDVVSAATYVANFGVEYMAPAEEEETVRLKARKSCRKRPARKRARCVRMSRRLAAQARARA